MGDRIDKLNEDVFADYDDCMSSKGQRMPIRTNSLSHQDDDTMSLGLLEEVVPLLAVVRTSLSELRNAHGRETLDRFFESAPLDACVRLADIWSMAAAVGVDMETIRNRFDPEDQFLIDLVTTIYTAGRGTSHVQFDNDELPELVRLVGESTTVLGEPVEALHRWA